MHFILDAEVGRGRQSLLSAHKKVREAHAANDPDVKAALDRDPDATIDIRVSFDGSWHKRGRTSKYGIGAAIDCLTGQVVDYEVLSTYCHLCVNKDNKWHTNQITQEEYNKWKMEHKTDCARNHDGSPQAMESAAAEKIWNRSVRFNFRYTHMLTDWDSKS